MIWGITGYPCAGKGEVSNILKERGFTTLALSDLLRERLKILGVEITRQNLIDIANFMRERMDNNILMKIALQKIGANNVIIEGIRHPEEVKELKKYEGKLIFIQAAQEVRFARMIARNREKDPSTWNDFLKEEGQQEGTGKGSGLRIKDCEEMADIVIENNGTFEELRERVEKILLAEAGKHPEQTKLPEMYNRE
ncbi:AAA family ATPase [Candidatus Woesearchaeota archaeon]|nr:AAA family ATPase [Candidatus Woesearchaeota archaeon]